MSYVNLTPAYYAAQRPGTPYHPGGRGWLQANVPGWGENPNVSWPGQQAADGLGAEPVPPFSYVGIVPFQQYIRTGIAPWGTYPRGPAYAAPRPLACKTCVGMPIRPGIGAMGAACGPCELSSGGGCVPCPEGSDVEECAGCVGGARKAAWYDHPLAGPVAIGVMTAISIGLVTTFLKKSKVPVGD